MVSGTSRYIYNRNLLEKDALDIYWVVHIQTSVSPSPTPTPTELHKLNPYG